MPTPDTFAVTATYIAHPTPAAGTSPVADGKPLDAGTVQIYQQNVHHLARQTSRVLVSDLGPGALPAKNGWAGVNEMDMSSRTGEVFEISWSPEMCYRHGPFHLIRDNDTTDTYGEESRPRRIRCWAWGRRGTATSINVYFAVTATPRPPTDGYVAFSRQFTTSTSNVKLEYTAEIVSGGILPRSCGGTTTAGAGSTTVEELWVWIGWRIVSGTGWVHSQGAYEMYG